MVLENIVQGAGVHFIFPGSDFNLTNRENGAFDSLELRPVKNITDEDNECLLTLFKQIEN